MPRRLRVFSASINSLMLVPCRQVCMNCLAWFKLNNSRLALASPICRMPRFLFQTVLERVRCGIARAMSFPLNAAVETPSAKSTIFPSVALSRSLTRLFELERAVFFLAMIGLSLHWSVSEQFVAVGRRLFLRLLFRLVIGLSLGRLGKVCRSALHHDHAVVVLQLFGFVGFDSLALFIKPGVGDGGALAGLDQQLVVQLFGIGAVDGVDRFADLADVALENITAGGVAPPGPTFWGVRTEPSPAPPPGQLT